MEAGKIIGSLIAKLSLDSSDFIAGMDRAKAKLSIGEAVEKTGAAFTKIGAAVTAAAGLTLKSAIDFEDAFIGVRKTVDAPPGSNANAFFDSLRQDMFDMAREVPSSLEAIAGVYAIGGQLGIESENLTGFSRAMIDLSNSTNLTSEAAAVGFAKLANVTGTSQTEFTNLGSAIVALGNNLATSESEILDITQNIALAGTQAGISAPELMGWGGAMKSLGLESASAGTAFSRFTNQVIMDVAEGGKNLDILAKTSGLTSEEFTKAFKDDASGALQTFLSGLGQLGSDEQLAVFDKLGIAQMREIETLGALANNTDLVTKALGLSTTAYTENTALSKEAALRYGGMKSQLGMLRNDFNEVAIIVGEALLPAFRDLMAWLRPIVQRFGEWAKANPKLIAGLIKAGMVIGGLGVAMLGVLKVISVIKTIQSIFATFAGIGKIGALFAKIGPAIAGAGKAILGFAATAGKAIAGLIVWMGPIGWIIGAIVLVLGGLFLAWKNNWFGMRDILNNFWNNTLKPFFESVGEFFGKIGSWIAEIWGKITGFFAKIGAIIGSIAGALAGFFSSLFSGIWTIISGIGEIFGAIWGVLAGAFSGVGEWIGEKLQPVIDWFKNAPAKIAEAVSTWWTNIVTSFTEFKNKIVQKIEEIDLKQAIADLAKKIAEGVGGWWTAVQTKINEFIDKLIGTEGLGSSGDKIYTVVTGLWQKIVDGIGQWWTNVKTKVGEFLESIKTEIGNIDLIETAGKIIDKLVEGFNAAKDKVISWFKGVLEGIPLVGNLFKDEATGLEAGTVTTEVTNMVAIDAFSGVPQAVLDSFDALNQKIMALNLSIPILNLNLGAASGLLFVLTAVTTYLSGDATTAFTNFATLISLGGVFGLALDTTIKMFSLDGGLGLKQTMTLVAEYMAGDFTTTFTNFATFISIGGTFGDALDKLIKTLSQAGNAGSLKQTMEKVADYIKQDFTTTFTNFESHLKEKTFPAYEALEKLLYSGTNSVFNALGEILGVVEAITAAMELQAQKIRGRLVRSYVFLETKTGIAVGALQGVSGAAAGVASEMNAAAAAVYGLIAALEALNSMGFGGGNGGNSSPEIKFAAEGGRVRASETFIVGERGPELFTPKRSGWIIPNDKAFGNRNSSGGPKIHIEIHDIYGDANLEQRISNGVKRGLQEAEFHGIA